MCVFLSRPQAVDAGATVLFGDADMKPSLRKPAVGYYVSPTILGGLADGDEAWDAEIFGPVRVLPLPLLFVVDGPSPTACRAAMTPVVRQRTAFRNAALLILTSSNRRFIKQKRGRLSPDSWLS